MNAEFDLNSFMDSGFVDKKDLKNARVKENSYTSSMFTWKRVWKEVYNSEYDSRNDAHLLAACNILVKVISKESVELEPYLRWAFTMFEDVVSPHFLTWPSRMFMYKDYLALSNGKEKSSGYLVTETDEVVNYILGEDGQLLDKVPVDGFVYLPDGRQVKVMKI